MSELEVGIHGKRLSGGLGNLPLEMEVFFDDYHVPFPGRCCTLGAKFLPKRTAEIRHGEADAAFGNGACTLLTSKSTVPGIPVKIFHARQMKTTSPTAQQTSALTLEGSSGELDLESHLFARPTISSERSQFPLPVRGPALRNIDERNGRHYRWREQNSKLASFGC